MQLYVMYVLLDINERQSNSVQKPSPVVYLA